MKTVINQCQGKALVLTIPDRPPDPVVCSTDNDRLTGSAIATSPSVRHLHEIERSP
ncbi:hypothetical protein JJD41_00865 [Oxynema sp. CENA135]|uniref:hypothetical protein n=1 Tax=Oxynema sp. CENA135 TaxID=984206 RepID=UPI00190C7218|nr:hypothetical protein [Oxynema sp. CENA135]MBK4728444.1 hypothetical protein [Oxynema sp. CENA135]